MWQNISSESSKMSLLFMIATIGFIQIHLKYMDRFSMAIIFGLRGLLNVGKHRHYVSR